MNQRTLAAFIVAVSAILFFVFALPKFDELRGYRHVRDDRKVLLADTQAAQANITKLLKDYQSDQKVTEDITLAIPDKRRIDSITNSFQVAANNAGMQLNSLALSDGQKGTQDYQTVQIKSDLAGSYPNFLILLQSLENSLRIYDINRLTISAPTNGLNNFSLQLVTYSLK